MILSSIAASDLPMVTPVFTPMALLLTSAMVGCLGAAVLLLSKPPVREQAIESTEDEATELTPLEARPLPLPMEQPLVPQDAAARVAQALYTAPSAPFEPVPALAEAVEGRPGMPSKNLDPVPGVPQRAVSSATRTLGASALMADAKRLLPNAPAPQHVTDTPAQKSRPAGPFQPAARFSRSQQAFLRVPIVVTGRDEAGAEFREETITSILLPQGAVIHLRHRVVPGSQLTIFRETQKHEAACTVFGALPAASAGAQLVEIDFDQPQRTFWPVSFPAWSGKDQPASAANPSRSPALTNSGS